MEQPKFIDIPNQGLSQVEYAKTMAQILMLKAYHFNKPQTLRLTCGDESLDIIFTKESIEHLIPLEFRY